MRATQGCDPRPPAPPCLLLLNKGCPQTVFFPDGDDARELL